MSEDEKPKGRNVVQQLRDLWTFTRHHWVACLVLGLIGGVLTSRARLGPYAAAEDTLGFAWVQTKWLLGTVWLAPFYAAILGRLAMKRVLPGQVVSVVFPLNWIRALLTLVVVCTLSSVATLAASLLLVVPGLFVLTFVYSAPVAAACEPIGPIGAFKRGYSDAFPKPFRLAGVIYAIAHLGSLLATYTCVVAMVMAFDGAMERYELIQPLDMPNATLNAWLDGMLLSFAHLPLAMHAAGHYVGKRLEEQRGA
jgi:hypothetical protein